MKKIIYLGFIFIIISSLIKLSIFEKFLTILFKKMIKIVLIKIELIKKLFGIYGKPNNQLEIFYKLESEKLDKKILKIKKILSKIKKKKSQIKMLCNEIRNHNSNENNKINYSDCDFYKFLHALNCRIDKLEKCSDSYSHSDSRCYNNFNNIITINNDFEMSDKLLRNITIIICNNTAKTTQLKLPTGCGEHSIGSIIFIKNYSDNNIKLISSNFLNYSNNNSHEFNIRPKNYNIITLINKTTYAIF